VFVDQLNTPFLNLVFSGMPPLRGEHSLPKIFQPFFDNIRSAFQISNYAVWE